MLYEGYAPHGVALLVETGQKNRGSASFVNQQWLWFNVAQMLAVLTAGYLIEFFSPLGALRAAAWIAALAPFAILGSISNSAYRSGIDLRRVRLPAGTRSAAEGSIGAADSAVGARSTRSSNTSARPALHKSTIAARTCGPVEPTSIAI